MPSARGHPPGSIHTMRQGLSVPFTATSELLVPGGLLGEKGAQERDHRYSINTNTARYDLAETRQAGRCNGKRCFRVWTPCNKYIFSPFQGGGREPNIAKVRRGPGV